MLSDLLYRLSAVFRRKAVDEELDDELRFHFERETEKLQKSGLSREEALRRARLAVGGMGQLAEECREARGVRAIESTIQDLRYGLRGMRRSPAFTAAAVLTLGLGTGAIATVFTLANTLFYRELPVERPDELVHVTATRLQGRARSWVSYPDYVHFRNRTKTLQGLAAHYSTAPLFVTVGQQSKEINGAMVSSNFFPLLRVTPALGRFFRQDEDTVPDRDRVAVIGHELWRNWFGASPDALGRTIKINGVVFTVIGVAPSAFRGVTVQPSEVFIPTMMSRAGTRWCKDALAADCRPFDMIGRLAEGRTVEEARAEMPTLVPGTWANAAEGENTGATAVPATGVFHPDLSRGGALRFIRLLIGVAGLLLLVCCANLAGLLIARNSARAREFAIRSSVGAGRARLVRQLVTESLLLAVFGGGLGVLFSVALTAGMNSSFYSVDFAGRPLHYVFTLEPRVIAAVLAVSAAAGLGLGLIPALKPKRGGPRVGRWLVGAQAAVAVALAAVAGLLTAGARMAIDGINFDSSHVAGMRLRPGLLQYAPERAQRFHRAAMERLTAMPGVDAVSLAGRGGLSGRGERVSVGSVAFDCRYLEIAPRYFETLRTPVLRGREFDGRDTLYSPAVAVVNETLARRAGEFLTVKGRTHRVVGVVKDIQLQNRGAATEPYVYVPYWQNAEQVDAQLFVRVKGDPAAMIPALVRELNRADPDVPVTETITLPAQLAGSHQSLRITASFVSYAAILAVFLSAIGIYAALAFSVSRRTKEIGIRMAVGAASGAVRGMVMREGMTVILAGVLAGFGLAAASARLVRYLLYGTGEADAFWYGMAGMVVVCAGLLACWVPARRATRINPIVALKEQ